MPKLPVVSGKDIIKALRKIGFEYKHRKGSHTILVRKYDGRRVTVPDYTEIKAWLLMSIADQAGLTRDQMIELLK